MMGGAVIHWLVGEQCVGENRERKYNNESGMGCGKPKNQRTIVHSSHKAPLSFFRSPFFVLHSN